MSATSQIIGDLTKIIPEISLILTLCVVILASIVVSKERQTFVVSMLSLGGLLVAMTAVLVEYGNDFHSIYKFPLPNGMTSEGPTYGFSGMLVVDTISDFFKLIFFGGTALVILFSLRSTETRQYQQAEYYALLLAAVLGASFLVSSNNYLMLFLSLETLSLCSYVLAGYNKNDSLSAEASLKYVLYGSVASGVMLFGISYIYGMAGTLDISQSLAAISMREDSAMAILLAFLLVLGGLGFKISAVPFHFWTPDVYQGAPTPVTAFLAVISKSAGFAALIRVLLPLFVLTESYIPASVAAVQGPLLSIVTDAHLPLLFWIISAITMTVGNVVALRQTNLKRLLAYSSIAHAGYILMGMAALNGAALEAMLLYFAVYLFMNLGAFLIIMLLYEKTGSFEISTFKGAIYKNPTLVIFLLIIMVSLTGLPPTAGFVAKMQLFYAVVVSGINAGEAGSLVPYGQGFYFSLVIIAGVNTAISLYYYMNVIKVMVFERAAEGEADTGSMKFGVLDWLHMGFYVFIVLFFLLPPLANAFNERAQIVTQYVIHQ